MNEREEEKIYVSYLVLQRERAAVYVGERKRSVTLGYWKNF